MKLFTPSPTDLRNMVKAAEAKFEATRTQLQYYAQRAQTAHAKAEAASDSRDKAAWKAAAQTWERLANPPTEATYSMEPLRRDFDALKRNVAAAIDAPASAPAVAEAVTATIHDVARRFSVNKTPVTIEF